MAYDYEHDMNMSASPAEVETGRETHDDWKDGEDELDPYRRVLAASTISGDRVRNPAGEDLGKIEEIMLDIPSGRIAYGVLSFGGFLGIGNKLFALPWEALSLDERAHEFVLNVDKQKLETAPGFDKDNWPDMADPSWSSQIHDHWIGERQDALDREENP